MSNGYGYNTAVSPASTGGFPGYGGGWQQPTSMSMPMQMPVQMPMQMQQMQSPLVAGASTQPPTVPNGSFVTPSGGNVVAIPASEESYVENILRMNRGKMATFYMTYENNREWNAKVFRGIIEAAGRDHIIISDPSTGMRYLLLTLNLDYVTFDGPINYAYTFNGVTITNNTSLPSGTAGTTATTSSVPLGRP
ncbi:spore coat protein GerQ [Paenibacillus glycinis]|uniref:Spore coat protein GerQ n=1 Tax=Paenibacillus glycinis TaxID=2697035 RepID=A0ABW9XUL5_9BACL|nr:spore coat protein GerQ [Paenibacillus glycinis]NBD26226.1 spore coat protein GerQ [Paenibacillus glycinis]